MASLQTESKLDEGILKEEEDFFYKLNEKLNKMYKEKIEEEDKYTTPPGTPFPRIHLQAPDLSGNQEE